MSLTELMNINIGSVSANDYAGEALSLMREKNLAWAFVLDRSQVVGIVYARDLERLSEMGQLEQDVRELMKTNLMIVSPEVERREVERLLKLSEHGFVAVIHDDRPLGVITWECFSNPELDIERLAR